MGLSTLRAFKKPLINFDCSAFGDMIKLDNRRILSETLFTAHISYDHFLGAHVQGTERFVQLPTNVSRRIVDCNRDDVMAVTFGRRYIIYNTNEYQKSTLNFC